MIYLQHKMCFKRIQSQNKESPAHVNVVADKDVDDHHSPSHELDIIRESSSYEDGKPTQVILFCKTGLIITQLILIVGR